MLGRPASVAIIYVPTKCCYSIVGSDPVRDETEVQSLQDTLLNQKNRPHVIDV